MNSGKIPHERLQDLSIITPTFSHLRWREWLQMLKVWCHMDQKTYAVPAGLYALNYPEPNSAVVVAANHKLHFNLLRFALQGMPAWILVLDTQALGVRRAVENGSFGTRELIRKIQQTRLAEHVEHQRLIIPCSSAPGISEQLVLSGSAFQVVCGPDHVFEMPYFLKNNLLASERKRQVRFHFTDRLVFTPMEILGNFKVLFLIWLVFTVLAGFYPGGYAPIFALQGGLHMAFFLFVGLISGAILVPVLLPFIPGKSFAWKGALMGLTVFLGLQFTLLTDSGWRFLENIALLLMLITVSSYAGMNFTGSTTFTSLSGAKQELRVVLPMQAVGIGAALILWLISKFIFH